MKPITAAEIRRFLHGVDEVKEEHGQIDPDTNCWIAEPLNTNRTLVTKPAPKDAEKS